MKKIKENLPLISIYALFGLLWLALHFGCVRYGDDSLWLERAESINSFSDLWNNYIEHISTWSSRIVIDFFGRLVELSPMIVWRILDTVAIIFLVFQLDKIFNEDKNIRFTFFIMSAWCLYPFLHLASAGWMASTFTYLWPLSLLLYSVRIGKAVCEGKKVHVWQYILAGLAYIYAIDQQQLAVCVVLLCTVVMVIERKRINPYLVSAAIVAFVRLIFHLKWPGSESRMLSSIHTTFPNYKTMTLLDKLQIGAATAFQKVFFDADPVFLLTGVLLAILVFWKFDDIIHRAIVLIPNVILFLWGPLKSLFLQYFIGIYSMNNDYSNTYGMIHNGNYFGEKPYILFFICGFAIICMLVSIVAVFGMSKDSVIYSTILIIGFCSRITMGFSPTVYVSGARTYLFLYFSFIILMIAFAKKIVNAKIRNARWVLSLICIWGAVTFINACIWASVIR